LAAKSPSPTSLPPQAASKLAPTQALISAATGFALNVARVPLCRLLRVGFFNFFTLWLMLPR
jgi:hypothetical protein